MKRLFLIALVACGHHEHHETPEAPTTAFTRWTAQHEFFVEHPPFVAGKPTALAVHVTKLADHKPVTGSVTVTLANVGATVKESRPGIFRPEVTPTAAGPCTLVIKLPADEVSVPCTVHASGAKIPATEDDPPGRISYLKETAWTTDIEIVPTGERELVPTLRTTGEIRATSGREARLTATTHGRVLVDSMPVLGAKIAAGQVLARIVPQATNAGDRVTLVGDSRQARAELAAAETELARSNRLWEARAIPEKQLDAAKTRVEIVRAQVAAAQGRLSQFDVGASGRGTSGATYQVRSPIAGTLIAIHVSSNQSVEDGDRLFTVVDLDRIWLHADIFEPDVASVETASRAAFRVDGYEGTIPIAPPDGRVVTIGKLVDEKTRTVPMIFELANPDQRLRIGSFATVWIETGAPTSALAIPETAIVDDAGRKVAYVQVSGESFERRLVTVGMRSGGWVEIKSGIAKGDRVVTRGAYEIKLAASGGAVPEHGHAH
ncbi:MAG: efflux RND transporter periplasmic adaptor subunit [Myxococcota bacterium]|nr:efflux RND transporter periplasmic adaptor subunit [Deltaproteobacteria bacterium]MDQ3335938.1 efflux RND transporter periplasmic adaptor subunit [Myxococcota bacterium]